MKQVGQFAFNRQVYDYLYEVIGPEQYALLREMYHCRMGGENGFHTFCAYLMTEHAELVAPAVAKARLLE